MKSIKTVFIVGPTASGKTALGAALAEKFGGEVVSADSMQIYKGIHIASAAPHAPAPLSSTRISGSTLEANASYTTMKRSALYRRP